MEPFMQLLAVLCASLFAGSALYGSLVESRATLALAQDDPVAHFGNEFRWSGLFQAPLVLIGATSSVLAALFGIHGLWIVGAVLMVLEIVITGVFIIPVNAKLLNRKTPAGTDRRLLIRWYRLHAIRGVLALAAAIIFLTVLMHAF